MISPHNWADAFQRNVDIIKLQTQGISHDESLIQLPFRGNCLNWIVGHILTNRNSIFKLLDAEHLQTKNPLECYQRESKPITRDGQGVIPLHKLIHLLEDSQANLAELSSQIKPEFFEKSIAFIGNTDKTRVEWLHFFYFHDRYHTGQTEILRQATGKDDKVI